MAKVHAHYFDDTAFCGRDTARVDVTDDEKKVTCKPCIKMLAEYNLCKSLASQSAESASHEHR